MHGEARYTRDSIRQAGQRQAEDFIIIIIIIIIVIIIVVILSLFVLQHQIKQTSHKMSIRFKNEVKIASRHVINSTSGLQAESRCADNNYSMDWANDNNILRSTLGERKTKKKKKKTLLSPLTSIRSTIGQLLIENAAATNIVNFSPLCPTIHSGSLRFRSFKYIFMQLYFITK